MFDIGDTVMLKSGGPIMTVLGMREGTIVVCAWFEEGMKQTASFPAQALQLADAEPPRPMVG
jgi:uncharacterized protein YodC (DUF2158 family)